MNSFSTFRIIPAENIVRANVRPDHIPGDVRTLIDALQPVSIITNQNLQKTKVLHSNVIQKLNTKQHALQLLAFFGYTDNGEGKHAYQEPRTSYEVEERQRAANEFDRFFNDLKRSNDGSQKDLRDFLQSNTLRQSFDTFNYDSFVVDQQRSPPSSPRNFHTPAPSPPRARSPPRMPGATRVNEDSARTAEFVRSFKMSFGTKHGNPPPHSFIRRKLLVALLKQKNPSAIEFGNQMIEDEVDERVRRLKNKDRGSNPQSRDDVYYECLLRSHFDEDKAVAMLRNNRPNLKPPPERPPPREQPTTTIAEAAPYLEHLWQLVEENVEDQAVALMAIGSRDPWKRMTHVVPGVVEIRQQLNDRQVDEFTLSKMFRLLYTELSRIIRDLSALKIELLAYALCETPLESFEHLSIIDIRDIVNSCGNREIRDDFQEKARQLLAIECPMCFGSYPRSRMESMFLCNHSCCVDCAKNYYRGAVKDIGDSTSLNKLTCFCEHLPITDDVRWNFFQFLGAKLNQWFTDERLTLETYHENLFMATRDSQIKKCGNPRCVSFFDANNNNQVARVQCPHCQFRQCRQCCRKWLNDHNEMSCEHYAEWLLENDPDDPEVQLMNYLNTAGMVCPNENCQAIYEYQAGGCEHFTCRECPTNFCRTCSALFYNPKHNQPCPKPECPLRNTFHAHCALNCYREIRDASEQRILELLAANGINANQELQLKPVATGPVCPVEGCGRPPSNECGNRFCTQCYKEFLCQFVWRRQIEPWTLYEDNNLRQKLGNANVPVTEQATRDALIALARQHLTQFLGKPKKMRRPRQ